MAEAKKTAKKAEEPSEEELKEKAKKTVTKTAEPKDKEVVSAKAGKRSAKAVKETEQKAEKEQRKQGKEIVSAKPKASVKPPRSKLERRSKKFRKASELIDKSKEYKLSEAVELAARTSTTKFDSSVEMHVNLGVDPKQADQNVRDTVVLPAGTGRNLKVEVFDEGNEALLAKLDKGELDFDVLITTPQMMPKLAKYARVLGPRGLMPNPKSGTVTTDVKKAVEQAKAGRVEYRVDSTGIIHLAVGKVSFGADKLQQNVQAVVASIKAAKPASLKGNYIKAVHLTSTMGPSVKVSLSDL